MTKLEQTLENYRGEVQGITDRITELRATLRARDNAQLAMAALQERRKTLLAEAMISGSQAGVAAIDKEIAAATQADEQAEITRRAIQMLEEQKAEAERKIKGCESDIRIARLEAFGEIYSAANERRTKAREILVNAQSEMHEARDAVRQIVLDSLMGKVEGAMKFYENELLPELSSKISSSVSEASRKVVASDPTVGLVGNGHTNRSEHRAVRTYDSVFTKIEFKLRPAAAAAEVLAEDFKDDTLKRSLLGLLKALGLKSQNAAGCGFSVPEWAFSGDMVWRLWITSEHTNPIREFVRDADVSNPAIGGY